MDALMSNLSVLWNWSSFQLKRQESVGVLRAGWPRADVKWPLMFVCESLGGAAAVSPAPPFPLPLEDGLQVLDGRSYNSASFLSRTLYIWLSSQPHSEKMRVREFSFPILNCFPSFQRQHFGWRYQFFRLCKYNIHHHGCIDKQFMDMVYLLLKSWSYSIRKQINWITFLLI